MGRLSSARSCYQLRSHSHLLSFHTLLTVLSPSRHSIALYRFRPCLAMAILMSITRRTAKVRAYLVLHFFLDFLAELRVCWLSFAGWPNIVEIVLAGKTCILLDSKINSTYISADQLDSLVDFLNNQTLNTVGFMQVHLPCTSSLHMY